MQVTLANDQPARWAVVEMASLAGLHLLESRPFLPELEFPGYTVRRHHTGKSFRRTKPSGNQRVEMQAQRFTFIYPAAGALAAPEAAATPAATADATSAHTAIPCIPIWLPAILSPLRVNSQIRIVQEYTTQQCGGRSKLSGGGRARQELETADTRENATDDYCYERNIIRNTKKKRNSASNDKRGALDTTRTHNTSRIVASIRDCYSLYRALLQNISLI